jgi:hypothetical protein
VREKCNLWNKGWCDRTRSRDSQGSWRNVCIQCYRRHLCATFLGDGRAQCQLLSNRCFSSLCQKISAFCLRLRRLRHRNGAARKSLEQLGERKWETICSKTCNLQALLLLSNYF